MVPLPTFTISNSTIAEGGNETFTITLSAPSTVATVITITTTPGTAGTGDYGVPSTTTVTIPAGQTTATVTVPALTDTILEGDETFTITGTVTSGNTSNPTATGTGTITNVPSIIANPNVYVVIPGDTTTSIFGNDTLNGLPIVIGTLPGQVTLQPVGTLPTGITLNPNGTITIAPGTPASSIPYTFMYTICENGAIPVNCSTTTVNITVNPFIKDLEVLNAVTPGTDGLNDVFTIIGIENYPNNSVEIFNRWGVLVYEATGYDNKNVSFKGESNGRTTVSQGSLLPDGTYFYILKYNKKADGSGDAKDQAGYLYINR